MKRAEQEIREWQNKRENGRKKKERKRKEEENVRNKINIAGRNTVED